MTNKPNVLCFSVDSLREDYCSFLHPNLGTTPYLESLAEDSTVYAQAISPSIWTLPVHTSVFTGLYPPEHQIADHGAELGSHETFAELLAADGYETKSFGYNGWLHQGDILRGFDSYNPDQPTEHGSNTVQRTGNIIERVFGSWVKDRVATAYNAVDDLRDRVHEARFPDDWLDETVATAVEDSVANADDPFCYFVHFNDVHRVYTPPSPLHRQFGDHSAARLFWHRFYWHEKIDASNDAMIAGELRYPEETVAVMRDLYKGCIYRVDQLLESIVERLETNGLLDETIIVVFGDHGDYLGEDGFFGHHHPHRVTEPVYRVPLLVHDPTETLPTGERSDIVQLNDLYPTLLELCGISPPETQSVSLLSDQRRQSGFVYFTARDSVYGARSKSVPPESMPPRRQFVIWEGPGDELRWDPDADEYWGQSSEDSAMRNRLRRHYEALEPVEPTIVKGGVENHVLDRIKQMGYMS
jgi:arylsulfatase A-like enzyme